MLKHKVLACFVLVPLLLHSSFGPSEAKAQTSEEEETCFVHDAPKFKLEACNKAIDAGKKTAKVLAHKGRALDLLFQDREALMSFQEAIKLDAMSGSPYWYQALFYQERDNHILAILNFSRVIELFPNDPWAYEGRGQSRWKRHQLSEALSDYNNAIRIRPDSAYAFSNRAGIYEEMGNIEEAKKDYTKSIELGVTNTTVYNNKCNFLRRQKDFENALRDCNMAIEIDGTNHYALDSRGDLWRDMKNYDAAIVDYLAALKVNPNMHVSMYNLGITYELKGDLNKALEYLSKYYQAQPHHSKVLDDITRIKTALTKITSIVASPPVLSEPSAVTLNKALKKVALIVGNGAYKDEAFLKNPINDAVLIGDALGKLGFTVVQIKKDLSREEMLRSLLEFRAIADDADWALFYYSGHAVEMNGINFLIPTDAKLKSDRDIIMEAIDLGKINASLDGARKLRLIILDACRNNPFLNSMQRSVATRSINQGLAKVEPEPGTLVAYAAKHGETALDGSGKNSPFASAFVSRILQTPSIEIRRLFDYVRDDVMFTTQKRQQPFTYGSISGSDEFYFR